jgi:hypothetical protein
LYGYTWHCPIHNPREALTRLERTPPRYQYSGAHWGSQRPAVGMSLPLTSHPSLGAGGSCRKDRSEIVSLLRGSPAAIFRWMMKKAKSGRKKRSVSSAEIVQGSLPAEPEQRPLQNGQNDQPAQVF